MHGQNHVKFEIVLFFTAFSKLFILNDSNNTNCYFVALNILLLYLWFYSKEDHLFKLTSFGQKQS
jgi:hypothetical protein